MQVFSRRARIAAVLTALLTLAFAITTLVTLQRLQGMPMTVTTVDMDLRSEKALTVRASLSSSRIETPGAGYWCSGRWGVGPGATRLTSHDASCQVRERHCEHAD